MNIFIYTDLKDVLKNNVKAFFKDKGAIYFRDEHKTGGKEFFQECDLLLGNPPKSWFSAKLPNLKFWQLDSAGFDQYQEVQVNAVVSNMGDFFAVKCAETMVGGILAFYRQIHVLSKLQAEKKWVGKPIRYQLDLLSNKKVLILGAGTIAQSIKKQLSGFECRIKLTGRSNPLADIVDHHELIAQLPTFDIVINTLPGKAGLFVTEELLKEMKSETLYASVGRGNTTDEDALIKFLISGKLAGAVLDVTEKEPLPSESPLWNFGNVILTQHSGGGYKFEDEGKLELFIRNAGKFLNNQPVENQIDLRKGY